MVIGSDADGFYLSPLDDGRGDTPNAVDEVMDAIRLTPIRRYGVGLVGKDTPLPLHPVEQLWFLTAEAVKRRIVPNSRPVLIEGRSLEGRRLLYLFKQGKDLYYIYEALPQDKPYRWYQVIWFTEPTGL